MEQQLIDWFTAHLFIRNLCLLAFGALLAGIRADWAKWQVHKAQDPTATFNWWVACRSYVYAMIAAVAPAISAEILYILGGTPQVQALAVYLWTLSW